MSPQLAFLTVTLHWETRTRSFHTIYFKKPTVRFYDPFQKKHKPYVRLRHSATPKGRGTPDQHAISHVAHKQTWSPITKRFPNLNNMKEFHARVGMRRRFS